MNASIFVAPGKRARRAEGACWVLVQLAGGANARSKFYGPKVRVPGSNIQNCEAHIRSVTKDFGIQYSQGGDTSQDRRIMPDLLIGWR